MPIWLQMARSYNDPESVNYKIAYLREQLKNDLGKLAYEDQVQVAMLGETVIIGGFLNTELIRAKSIVAEMLAVEDLAAITGKFSGDVWVGGDIVVGGQGVLSVFQFESSGNGAFSDSNGWSAIGIAEEAGLYTKRRMAVLVSIPNNFTITKATLYALAMPTFYDDPIGGVKKWKQSRNLSLYISDGIEGYWDYVASSGISIIHWRSGTNITNAVWGASSWSPPLSYSGNDPSNTSNKIQIKSGDITSYLSPGSRKSFYVETTDSETESNFSNNQGLGKMIVLVEGYASVSK